jgi:hypothetical protein
LEEMNNKLSGEEKIERGRKHVAVSTGPKKKGATEDTRGQEYRYSGLIKGMGKEI